MTKIQRVSSLNRYDKALFLLLLSLLYGFNSGSAFISPCRILSFLFLPLIIPYISLIWMKLRTICVVLIVFFLYGFFSLLWTSYLPEGKGGIIQLFLNILIFLEILILSLKAKKPLSSIANAWILILSASLIIGIWEIVTDNHLSSAEEVSEFIDNMNHIENHVAVVTFYNSNTYVVFIVMSLMFVLFKMSTIQEINKQVWYFLIYISSTFVLLMNSSRGGVACLLIMTAISIWFISKKNRTTILTIALFSFIFLYHLRNVVFESIVYRVENQGFEDNARLIMWISSWNIFLDTFPWGTGIGSMMPVLRFSKYNKSFIECSHNMVLEFLLEGGIVFGFIIFLVLIYLYRSIRKTNITSIKLLLFIALGTFPIYSIINSNYLKITFIWCFFASLFVFATPSLYRNKMYK